MIKIKSWHFTPQMIICYILLVAILIAVISGKPQTHFDRDIDGVVREYTPPVDEDQTGHYFYGQVLYPDYVHQDTLVIVDPIYMNQCMADGMFKSDGDIMEILNECTMNFADFIPYNPGNILRLRDYQVEIDENGATWYDGHRKVKFIPYNGKCNMDKLIDEDNR